MNRPRVWWTSFVGVAFLVSSSCGVDTDGTNQSVASAVSVESDFRVVDRGFQDGRSATAGWAGTRYEISSAFTKPWPIEFSRKELIDTAMARMNEYLDANSTPRGAENFRLHFDDSLSASDRSWITDLATLSVNSLRPLVSARMDLIVGEPTFISSTIEALDLDQDTSNFCGLNMSEGAVSACADFGLSVVSYGETVASGELAASGSLASIGPHELFHSAQDNLLWKQGWVDHVEFHSKFVPIWFTEGSAEFFGYAVSDHADVASYYVSPWEWWYYLPNPDIGLAEYDSRLPFPHPPEDYWMGQMASEYIVANVGFEKLMDIWSRMGDGADFATAFEGAVGLSLSMFYETFDAAYRHMFYVNDDLTIYSNRECPDSWDCSVFRGEPEFEAKILAQSEQTSGVDGPCFRSDVSWWNDCLDIDIDLPAVAENSDHGRPVEWERITPSNSCAEMWGVDGFESGIAATFDLRVEAGAPSAEVSTQWYAKLHRLDVDLDGVICSTEAPEGEPRRSP